MALGLSITRWIGGVRGGDSGAAREVWGAYFPRMVALARRRLRGLPRRAADEEDVALSAFKSFCGAARRGQYAKLIDRHALWSLLCAITAHKCVDLIRRENRGKRGGGRPVGPGAAIADVQQVAGRAPGPASVTQAAEEAERLLDRLDRTGDPTLRVIARWKLDGDSTADVAERLGCVRRTVERKLQLIATIWERELDHERRRPDVRDVRPADPVADAPVERGV